MSAHCPRLAAGTNGLDVARRGGRQARVVVPRDIAGQDPEPVAGTIDVQRRVDPQASVQDEPDIPAEAADRTPYAPRRRGPHTRLTHPPRQIRHIPHGPAGRHGGHGNHIGLLIRAFAVGDDAVDRVPLRRSVQVIIGGAGPGRPATRAEGIVGSRAVRTPGLVSDPLFS
ncbi:hypothetical protein [Streptomyces venezuelae]|uniref:hypothetical protein n=1 Tax=Streptomyces venezuelae TaxID=54571 RepID=UPI003323AB3F